MARTVRRVRITDFQFVFALFVTPKLIGDMQYVNK